MRIFKERIPTSRCAYKTGEYEISQTSSLLGIVALILGIFGVVEFHIVILLYVCLFGVSWCIDVIELRRRGVIIDKKREEEEMGE